MQSIALIDYGSGNLRSAEKALVKAGEALDGARRVVVTADPDLIARADRIVLPGVGAFAACAAGLHARSGVTEALEAAVRGRGTPFLGICVGMQLMASRGLEFRTTLGLDWIGGEVRRLTPDGAAFKVPHMGWNDIQVAAPHPLFEGLGADSPMYFTHSFAFFPDDAAAVAASVDHGGRFAAAVAHGNMAGVQFHPEKSQAAGLRLLANFLDWRP
ncbi:imidazole glycerol phosphate synthase subunit HisH [Phenylobacterium montanum]|uniref:Imidazole glycerol phosphate synthase subunit HisH n=1 Tax=Phenylobacterium montanum TaxID=2823693 RepID=A0A975FWE1_9CAUL|nr:imidazole glycerol phosphate synthase subunit HisH [Caulobacter sp. S6]QUD86530.1 imidazole glycerol phosphate synthase subunit HisH [Caulobacter sp. S6]